MNADIVVRSFSWLIAFEAPAPRCESAFMRVDLRELP
jgi:hypothetical protein